MVDKRYMPVQNLTNVKRLKLCSKKDTLDDYPPPAKCINIWLQFQIKVTFTSNKFHRVFLSKSEKCESAGIINLGHATVGANTRR